MCSIFGVGFLKGHKVTNKDLAIGMISKLAREAEIGGRQASGISVMREKSAHVIKRPIGSSKLVKSLEYQDFMDDNIVFDDPENNVVSVIGHCRLPTQGSINNNNNNHPLIVKHIIGVHNGVVSNDHELFINFKDKFQRIAEVDTEIIFQLVAHFCQESTINTAEAIKKAATHIKGSFACAMQNSNHPYNLYLFRTNNPIRLLIVKNLGIVAFATREHYITKSLEMLADKPEVKEMEIINDAGMNINLYNRTYSKFTYARKIK